MLSGMEILRFVSGKAVEHWEEFNSLTLLQQLGAAPPLREPTGEWLEIPRTDG